MPSHWLSQQSSKKRTPNTHKMPSKSPQKNSAGNAISPPPQTLKTRNSPQESSHTQPCYDVPAQAKLRLTSLPDDIFSKPARVRQFACTTRTFIRLIAVFAVVVSAVFARPLHELEHAGTGSAIQSGRSAACSCGHLHGSARTQKHPADRRSGNDQSLPPNDQRDGTHSHHSCGICLAFGLQTPAETAEAVSLEFLRQPVASEPARPQRRSDVAPLPPLRGPPAV